MLYLRSCSIPEVIVLTQWDNKAIFNTNGEIKQSKHSFAYRFTKSQCKAYVTKSSDFEHIILIEMAISSMANTSWNHYSSASLTRSARYWRFTLSYQWIRAGRGFRQLINQINSIFFSVNRVNRVRATGVRLYILA